jgi:hypothetical protein
VTGEGFGTAEIIDPILVRDLDFRHSECKKDARRGATTRPIPG